MPRYRSEETKAKDLERQKANYTTLNCVVRKEEGEAFRAWCAAKGSNVRAELLAYVRSCIGEEKGRDA